ncbi:MAG: DNA primase [Acidobacteriota bacterium]
MEIKDQIKRIVTITDVISMYGIDMKPAGKYYKALCPFHNEKTPSFFIKPETDTFACYGCNKFGDIFTFVQDMENIGFIDAMNMLVEKFNIPVEKNKAFSYSKEKHYLQINESVLRYYISNLFDSPGGRKALEYLETRMISQSTIKTFQLGYAEDSWDGLYKFLKKSSYDINKSIELGLLIKNEKGDIYDRFRGRIIFPIFSESGSLIAFGGRTVIDDKTKYLNSPETPLYKKGKNLYGFNITKQFIREKKSSILVEGYFDVVSLYQHGVKNVAASLGTALTPGQIHLLRRLSEKIYIGYDNDKAGINAAIRGMERMFEQNVNPWIISIPGEKDPDDFIRKNGKESFLNIVKSSKDGFKFLLEFLLNKYDVSIPEKKRDAVREVTTFLKYFDDMIVRRGYTTIASDFFNVPEKEFRIDVAAKDKKEVLEKELELFASEKIFLNIILNNPEFIEIVKPLFTDKLYSVLNSGNILKEIFNNYSAENDINYNNLYNIFSPAERKALRMTFDMKTENDLSIEDIEERLESSVVSFFRILNDIEISEIGKKLKRAERENNIEEVKKLIGMKNKYTRHKYKVSLGGNVGK